MERIQQRNFLKVTEIEKFPTIYEELENGKLRVVAPAELGIAMKERDTQQDSPNAFAARIHMPSRKPSTRFCLSDIRPLTIHEEMADGRMRTVDPAELGIKTAKVAPQLG